MGQERWRLLPAPILWSSHTPRGCYRLFQGGWHMGGALHNSSRIGARAHLSVPFAGSYSTQWRMAPKPHLDVHKRARPFCGQNTSPVVCHQRWRHFQSFQRRRPSGSCSCTYLCFWDRGESEVPDGRPVRLSTDRKQASIFATPREEQVHDFIHVAILTAYFFGVPDPWAHAEFQAFATGFAIQLAPRRTMLDVSLSPVAPCIYFSDVCHSIAPILRSFRHA
jgi:hypothetical protein